MRESSLSVTEKLSSIVIPATTITRLSIREQREIESGRLEEETFEVRIVTLEKRLNKLRLSWAKLSKAGTEMGKIGWLLDDS